MTNERAPLYSVRTEFGVITIIDRPGPDPYDDLIDVEVAMGDGSRWSASYTTPRFLERLVERNGVVSMNDLVVVAKVDTESLIAATTQIVGAGEHRARFAMLEGPRPGRSSGGPAFSR